MEGRSWQRRALCLPFSYLSSSLPTLRENQSHVPYLEFVSLYGHPVFLVMLKIIQKCKDFCGFESIMMEEYMYLYNYINYLHKFRKIIENARLTKFSPRFYFWNLAWGPSPSFTVVS